MWPQSGDDAAGSVPAGNGVPAERHVTSVPSPIDHTTRTGVAVAVTDTPGTDTVADSAAQLPGSSHNHTGRFTNCGPGGLEPISGAGSHNCRYADTARSAGDTTPPPREPAENAPDGSHTGPRNKL